MRTPAWQFAALLLPLTVIGNAQASCGSTFCTVNTQWDAQGLVNDTGLRVDLRYSYARADRLRSGSSRITPAAPDGTQGEIENMRTVNQVLDLDLDYAVNSTWNVALGVPFVMRDHAHTLDEGGVGVPPVTEQAKFDDFGDVRVTGKYKFNSSDHHSGGGIRFGLKLPSGSTSKEMAPGKTMERSLQPGSGSTDVILGADYHTATPGSAWGCFASGQLQVAARARDNYRPGKAVNLDLGSSYAFSPVTTGLLQLNIQFRERDSGLNANPASGGHSLNFSPGLSYAVAPKTRLYGFVQLPLLQYANGNPADPAAGQLTAPWSLSLGVSRLF